MKNRTLLLSGILLVLIVVGVLFGLYYVRATAQPDVITYLQERLKQQNVPVVEISILQQSPMRLQVTIQSKSDGKNVFPDDPINRTLVRREVILANQRGYAVERIIIIVLNNKGEQISKVDHSANVDSAVGLHLSVAMISDDAAKKLIADKINLYGMTVTNMDVASSDGFQFVTLQLSTPSLEEANRVMPDFVPSLRPLLDDVNSQGAQLATFKLEIKDGQGNFLFNYMIDLQTHSESAWMADGLTRDWLPNRPPSP